MKYLHTFNRFLLPGLFLLSLGIGNIAVGSYKEYQYADVIKELNNAKTSSQLVHASPLRRIQLARKTANRLYRRKQKAQEKALFYQLVTYGGKLFLALGIAFLLLGILPKVLEPKKITI